MAEKKTATKAAQQTAAQKTAERKTAEQKTAAQKTAERKTAANTERRPHHARSRDERVRQPTEIRRGLIIAAARAVLAERGVVNTTVRDIATASEVSLGTVTYHFTGIAEILAEVLVGEMTQFYQPILADALAAADASGALRTVIDGFFADDERTWQHWRLWLDFWSLSAHDEVRANWQADTYQRWRGDVRTILVRGREADEFVFDDLDIALTEFLAVFDGLAGQAFLPGSTVGPPQARAHLHGYIDRRLRATAKTSTATTSTAKTPAARTSIAKTSAAKTPTRKRKTARGEHQQ